MKNKEKVKKNVLQVCVDIKNDKTQQRNKIFFRLKLQKEKISFDIFQMFVNFYSLTFVSNEN